MNGDPAVLSFLLDKFVTSNAAKSLQIHALEYSKAADKILHMLFYLAMVHGKEQSDGSTLIDVPLTQQDLANLLGLTRETTGIELLKLKRSGLLTLNRKRYRLDKSQLVQQLGESEFEELTI
jgi:CRP/FNR family transcriptional regulator